MNKQKQEAKTDLKYQRLGLSACWHHWGQTYARAP